MLKFVYKFVVVSGLGLEILKFLCVLWDIINEWIYWYIW